MNGTQHESEPMNEDQQQTQPPAAAYAPAPQPVQAQPQPRTPDPRTKSPALACVLSAMPGLGQIYVGYYQRGFIHALIFGGIIVFLNLPGGFNPLIPGAAIFLAFFWLYNVIDAGRRAVLYNLALAGGKAIEMPEEISMPGTGGSILGGLVLIVVCFTLLLNTGFDYSLAWVKDWWPMGGILIGFYLLGKGILDRNKASAKTED